MKNLSYKRLTEITQELLRSFAEESAQAHDGDDKRRRHLWSSGAFLLWSRVSCELRSPVDVGVQADTSRFELLLAGQLELPLPPHSGGGPIVKPKRIAELCRDPSKVTVAELLNYLSQQRDQKCSDIDRRESNPDRLARQTSEYIDARDNLLLVRNLLNDFIEHIDDSVPF